MGGRDAAWSSKGAQQQQQDAKAEMAASPLHNHHEAAGAHAAKGDVAAAGAVVSARRRDGWIWRGGAARDADVGRVSRRGELGQDSMAVPGSVGVACVCRSHS